MPDERLTITIDRFEMRYPPGRWGAKYYYKCVSGIPEAAARAGSHGCNSVGQITEIIRRVYGKDTRIIQTWDGKERK